MYFVRLRACREYDFTSMKQKEKRKQRKKERVRKKQLFLLVSFIYGVKGEVSTRKYVQMLLEYNDVNNSVLLGSYWLVSSVLARYLTW